LKRYEDKSFSLNEIINELKSNKDLAEENIDLLTSNLDKYNPYQIAINTFKTMKFIKKAN